MRKHFIIATAGHVDHGKSALVQALTGVDPDRLPEEKARGITIDLGFAKLELRDAAGVEYQIGIVDVPGHEDFVKNMVSGVGAVDAALFVVAADDGWMPQSEEHLQILSYLGVTRAVIALTKADLLDAPRIEGAIAEVKIRLRNSPFTEALVVPCAPPQNIGVGELRRALLDMLREAPLPPDAGKPRLNVDRVFTLRGIGTVVTGSLLGGAFQRGMRVVVHPRGLAAHCRSLQSHNEEVTSASPGARTAINLPELSANREDSNSVHRGDTITLAEVGRAFTTLDALLEKSARTYDGRPAKPLKDGAIARWHHGAANSAARVHLIDRAALEPGARALAQLRFEVPVFALEGERFILRDWAEQHTLAGGTILAVDSSRADFRSDQQRAFLEARAANPVSCIDWVRSTLARDKAAPLESLLGSSIFSHAEIQSQTDKLAQAGAAIVAGIHVCDRAWWNAHIQKLDQLLLEFTATHPDQPGMPVKEVEASLGLPHAGLLTPLLTAIPSLRVQDGLVQRVGRELALPPELKIAGIRVRNLLSQKPIDPPSRNELAPDARTEQALRYFINSGLAIALSDEVVLLRQAFDDATASVTRILREQGPQTTGHLRQQLGASRRVIVPLLERLDRDGVTVREGDLRRLKL